EQPLLQRERGGVADRMNSDRDLAANRIAQALGTPNVPGRPVVVSAFAVHRLIAQGLLTGLSANPDGALLNPDQVEAMCRRPDLAQCVSPEAPLGPDQAAARLRVRRVDFDHMRTLGWIEPAERREVYFGTSRVNAVLIPMFRTGDIDALPTAHPEIDWDHLRALGKGRRSPLAALAGQHTAPA
ncbi:hypothetical protein, partial [Streptomyces minutiscleroticus]|uniref:hypothetical protein n=1 Tax=Streptomyces minutiscleroticus TaxID=68238 RepID=UPI0033305785